VRDGSWLSVALPTLGIMSLVVHLSEELARRVEAVAAERGVSPEQVAVEAIDAQVAAGADTGRARRRLAFAGIGASDSGLGAAQADEMLAEGFGRD